MPWSPWETYRALRGLYSFVSSKIHPGNNCRNGVSSGGDEDISSPVSEPEFICAHILLQTYVLRLLDTIYSFVSKVFRHRFHCSRASRASEFLRRISSNTFIAGLLYMKRHVEHAGLQ